MFPQKSMPHPPSQRAIAHMAKTYLSTLATFVGDNGSDSDMCLYLP
jgi:hypothetical protein